jgi:hypothetical protein
VEDRGHDTAGADRADRLRLTDRKTPRIPDWNARRGSIPLSHREAWRRAGERNRLS